MIYTNTQLFDLAAYVHASIFMGTQYPWEALDAIEAYIAAAQDFGTLATPAMYPGARIGDNVRVGKNVVIEPGVTIYGPALIGDNTEIRGNAYIRENVIIGEGCIIGNSTEIKNSILLNGVQVKHFNYVGDSVLGNGAHFGAGVVVTNMKSVQSTVVVTDADASQRIDTGRVKLGALVGDTVEVGSNAVLNPGTMIGKGSVIYPLSSIRGTIPEDSIVKLRQQFEVVRKKQPTGELDKS